MANSNVIELGTNVEHIPLEYVYMTIPADYVCVYHRILAMLADYGIDMLKDCKATCTDRNSGVIECFNMFNAAVAARKLGQNNEDSKYTKLAATLIKYIKAKINQIYGNKDNSTSFVFPVDENGEIKAVVSCGEKPVFMINPEDGALYEHKFDNGFDEHFRLGKEDVSQSNTSNTGEQSFQSGSNTSKLMVTIKGRYELIGNTFRPCADIVVKYNGKLEDVNNTSCRLYFDETMVVRFNDIVRVTPGVHSFMCVIKYKNLTAIAEDVVLYESTDN